MTIWIFRFLAKAQNDNSGVDFSLVSLAQNDSRGDFHCGYALQAAWLRFCKRLKMTRQAVITSKFASIKFWRCCVQKLKTKSLHLKFSNIARGS